MAKNNSALADSLTRISSEKRILLPSDDAIASVRLRMLQRDATILGQYRANISGLQGRMQQDEVTLRGIGQNIASAHDTMIWALNGSNTGADLLSMATPLRTTMEQILASANSADSAGNYHFSGTATSTAPIAYDQNAAVGARYSYAGNNQTQQVVIGNDLTQPANVDVEGLAGLLNKMDVALQAMQTPGVNINDTTVRAQINAAEVALNQAVDANAGDVSRLGSGLHMLGEIDAKHAAMLASNLEAATQVDGFDMADAYDQMTQQKIAIEATYKVYGKIMQLNPFDLL
jgi:flagellar hook-associated protein 3 FlgL